MSSEGLISEQMAETVVWSFYYQIAHSQDRRATLTPGQLEELRAEQAEREQQRRLTLWDRVQNFAGKFFGDKKHEEALRDATQAAADELAADEDKRGRVNEATGLPELAGDLATGRGVVTGMDLAMEVIVPPYDLAASCTQVLKDGGDPANEEDWQALAYRPKTVLCPTCRGRMRIPLPVASRQRTRDGKITCPKCNGMGKVDNWTPDQHATVKHNGNVIARVVHRLAEEGYFSTRPVNPRDVEMSDLVWENEAGMTLGFRLTYKGWKRMQELAEKNTDLRRMVHSLTYAGDEVRSQAPAWAKAEYERSKG